MFLFHYPHLSYSLFPFLLSFYNNKFLSFFNNRNIYIYFYNKSVWFIIIFYFLINIIFSYLLLLKVFLYLYNILSKILLESFFWIFIKVFFIEVLKKKKNSIKTLLLETVSNECKFYQSYGILHLFRHKSISRLGIKWTKDV